MSINIGEVIAVRGTQITLRIYDDSSLETLYYDGKKYKGVSIREYIGIKRGFNLIICIVEGEYLDENSFDRHDNQIEYVRKVDAKPIGYFERSRFNEGIKLMPMIKDQVYLLSEDQVVSIFSQEMTGIFNIGKMLKEDVTISLPWYKIFNSHIGVFGNTGSGKSNTLTKLYSELFNNFEEKLIGKSKFLLIDFNGEYVGNQLIKDKNNKIVFNLNTNTPIDRLPLLEEYLWDTEILSLLFQATTSTQSPFLNRLVEKKNNAPTTENLKDYIIGVFYSCLVNSENSKGYLVYLQIVAKYIANEPLIKKLSMFEWYDKEDKDQYVVKSASKWEFICQTSGFNDYLRPILYAIDYSKLDSFTELSIRVNLQLIVDLLYGNIQTEHIQPLLKRIDSSVNTLRKVFNVSSQAKDEYKLLTVISLRNCNQSMKKIIPLLLAKMFYQNHKDKVKSPPDSTLHLIIDEAHNILSQQSNREQVSWKDYRLELFEEIIKEGRKFGMYLTLASQRPADISPTIMSQIHNFFIHRLVNDKDLFLIDNTISTLDRMSKSLIPNLPKGACVITGTAFDLPVIMQVDYIEDKESRPASDDIDLKELWQHEENKD